MMVAIMLRNVTNRAADRGAIDLRATFDRELTDLLEYRRTLGRTKALATQFAHTSNALHQEDISSYVAELQLHMTLQARNLVPTLSEVADSRQQLLHDSQAELEKLASRQEILSCRL